ncbi:hypothetical protein [Portibacter marinus]|uniref:hypothetical protein n=1 Tax=Portibacter marinus TaxID=2898660 RepID=UPI001F1D220D|nr:hypothetical protein [Portibacter marinus]
MRLDKSSEQYHIPAWMKFFSYLFILFGSLIPIVLAQNLMGYKTALSIYGINSDSLFNPIGAFIAFLFALKLVVGFAIIKRLKWAFNLGIVDACLGLIVCLLNLGIYDLILDKSNININLRLEIFVLVPFLIYLLKNRLKWNDQHLF